MTLYTRQGDIRDLEEAIQCLQNALTLHPPGDPAKFILLGNLAVCLQDRYQRKCHIEDLQNSITFNEEVLASTPLGDPARGRMLHNIAACLRGSYTFRGVAQDLERAIECLLEALSLHHPDHQSWHRISGGLAKCLAARYVAQENVTDLEEAIRCYRNALSRCSEGYPGRSGLCASFAESLHTRYELFGDIHDLDEATELSRNALEFYSSSPPNNVGALIILGNCLQTRYRRLRSIQDLEEAIRHYKDADQISEPEHPDRLVALANLAVCLVDQYEHRGAAELLEEAHHHILETIKLLDEDHPILETLQAKLALMYATYGHLLRESPQQRHITDLFQRAVKHKTASVKRRLDIALEWVRVDKGDSVLEAYQRSLELVDQYLLIRSSIITRHQILLNIPPNLASDAAAAAITAGELEKAVEFLEQGKALLWSQMNYYRSPLQRLREVDDELASEFARLSGLLEKSARLQTDNEAPFRSIELEAREYRKTSDAWHKVVGEIRKLDGFESFLFPPTYSNLREAASEGPVVLITISNLRSDVIIVHKDGNPFLLPLAPHVRPQYIADLHSQFSQAVRAAETRKALSAILQVLWEDIVEPVVRKLRELNVEEGSRIWWCPTSHLAILPLHAAGQYRKGQPNLPSLYVSSYTPTLMTLSRSRQTSQSRARSSIPQLLIVAQSSAPNQPKLPSVPVEVAIIEKIVPCVTKVQDEGGTREAVLDSLPQSPWVQFTCHGSKNPRPFDSCFHLYKETLTITDIIQARLPDAQYAFLSACHSAAGDAKIPDETIHLAAALQFSGFRSVIGTMYAMADADGPALAEQIYKYMFRRVGRGKGRETVENGVDFRDSAEALHNAIKALRERKEGFPLEKWINFVHIGA
ncbi:hypothetical protein FRC03_000847 [Tulasnella sp. 419]|nr:hypothetical protein FRC03_000847 [Tulasnella sp. 419]